MRKRGLLVVAFLLWVIPACGVKTVRLRKFSFSEKRDPLDVEIFVGEEPKKEYVKCVTMQEESGDYEEILSGFRRRGAQMGMDAVIVHIQGKVDHVTKKDAIFGTEHTYKNIRATGIKYKENIRHDAKKLMETK